MRAAEATASPYRHVVIGVLAMATLVNNVVLFNLGVLLPAISEELDLSPSEQGWLGSSAVIANLIFILPMGWWLSGLNAKLVTTVSLVVAAFFIFVQGWAPVFLILIFARVLFGLAGVSREPARAMLTQQWVPPREIVVVNGVLNAMIGSGIGLGFLVAPLILVWTGDDWRLALFIFAAFTLAVGVIWQVLGKELITPGYRQRFRAETGTPLRSLMKYRQLWPMGMGIFGASLSWMAFGTFWPTLMLDTYDVSLVTSGILVGIIGFASAVTAILFAYMVAKGGTGKWILLACGLMISGSTVGLVSTGSLAPLVLLSLIQGFGWGFPTIIMTVPFQLPHIKPREIAVAVSFIEMSLWAGSAVGPVLAGFLQEATGDLRLTLQIIASFGLLLSLSGLFLPSKGERGLEEPVPVTGAPAPSPNPQGPPVHGSG